MMNKEYYLVKFEHYFADGDYDKFDHGYITKDEYHNFIELIYRFYSYGSYIGFEENNCSSSISTYNDFMDLFKFYEIYTEDYILLNKYFPSNNTLLNKIKNALIGHYEAYISNLLTKDNLYVIIPI